MKLANNALAGSICLMLAIGCAKKSAQEKELETSRPAEQIAAKNTEPAPRTSEAATPEHIDNREDKSAEAPAAESANTPKASVATGAALEPIEIDLPKAMFVGTPQNFRVDKLEKPLGKPRPPFLAPAGTKNVAPGKPISSTDEAPIIGEIAMLTDGDKNASEGSYVELGPFLQHVTIDLEASHEIYAVLLWHFHKQPRVYFDVIVQIADDAEFSKNVHIIFNNDHDNSAGLGTGADLHYVETSEGRLVDAKGVRGRYVRLYSNGNTNNDLNHYIEVSIYGKPIAG